MLSRIPAHSITPLTESPPHTRQPAAALPKLKQIAAVGHFETGIRSGITGNGSVFRACYGHVSGWR
jgi:hypothetical protein